MPYKGYGSPDTKLENIYEDRNDSPRELGLGVLYMG